MNLLRKRWLLLAAALPLLYLPLRAAEPPPAAGEAPPAATTDADDAVPLPTAETQAEEAEEAAEPAAGPAASPSAFPAAEAVRDEGEQLSLDNNLSFPVDI